MLSKIIVIGLFMSPLLASADSGETKNFVFQGQASVNLDLRGELSHTEYRTETYPGTCYRSEFSHYDTRCVNEPVTVCDHYVESLVPGPSNPKPGGPGGDPDRPPRYPEPGPSEPTCRTEYRSHCSQEPVYVDVPYSCTLTRQVPYTVKDADTLNHVIFNFAEVPAGLTLSDSFNVSVSGSNVLVSTQSNQVFYTLTKQQTQNSNVGGLVETTTSVNVAIDSIAAFNAPVSEGVTELTASVDGVSFMIGKVLRPETLIVNLHIKKSQFLGSKTMIDRDMQANEITLTDVGGKTRVDIKNMDLGLKSGRTFKIRAKVRLNASADIANPGAISTAQPEQSVKVSL